MSAIRFLLLGCLLLMALAPRLAGAAAAEPVFIPLGDLPGGNFDSHALGISPDGGTVVGLGTSAAGGEAFRWRGGGMTGLGGLPGGDFDSSASDASWGGAVVVGRATDAGGRRAFRWENGVMTSLGPSTSFADRVSEDGDVVAGNGPGAGGGGGAPPFDVFRWDQGQMTLVDGGWWGASTSLSADGSVMGAGCRPTGVSGPFPEMHTQACRWEAGTTTLLPFFEYSPSVDLYSSYVHVLSSDGAVMIVEASYWSVTPTAFARCTGTCDPYASGEVETFFHPQGAGVLVKDANHDVSVVVGSASNEAMVFDEVNGFRDLATMIENEYGIDLTGWTLTSANAISSDGNVIVGSGQNPAGDAEAWLFAFDGSMFAAPAAPGLSRAGRVVLVLLLAGGAAGSMVLSRRRSDFV